MSWDRDTRDRSSLSRWSDRVGRGALVWVALAPFVSARPQVGPQFGPRTPETSKLASIQLRARSVSWDEQELHGTGPGYQVQFDDQGFVFSTAGDATIRGVTESVGRRSDSSLDAKHIASDLLVADAEGVSYQRGSVVERYDLRADGVELSYVFEELPQGDGDLVVRIKIDTALRVLGQKARVGTLTFDSGERAVISVGAVTGVDANGRHVPGSMLFDDGMLELVLPGQFVQAAALPLTLDPVIGSLIYHVGRGGTLKSVAYDPVSDIFVVLMDSGQNYANTRILAQLMSPSGSLNGAPIQIGQGLYAYGDVVFVAARGRFLISYTSLTTSYLRTLDPVTRTMSPAVVAPGAFQLSGNMSSKGQALGTLSFGATLDIAAIDVDAAGNVSIQQVVPLTNSQIYSDITAMAGVNGRHMVVWTECNRSCNPVATEVWGAIIGHDGTVLEKRPITNSTRDEFLPYVDGDGSQWLVAYTVSSPTSNAEVECVLVFWDSNTGSSYNGNTVTLSTDPNVWERSDPVVFTGGSYITAYDNPMPWYRNGGQHMLLVDAIDGRSLALGPRFNSGTDALGASQHWRRSGAGNIALIVDGVTAYWYRVDDGITTDLGGGCGRGGHIGVSGAVSRLNTMTLHLRDSLPAVPAVLIVGSTSVNLPCGTCTLVPDPATGIALPLGVTDNHGNASVQVPITNLYGATFIEQWAILGGNACALGLELSNAVQVQIQ